LVEKNIRVLFMILRNTVESVWTERNLHFYKMKNYIIKLILKETIVRVGKKSNSSFKYIYIYVQVLVIIILLNFIGSLVKIKQHGRVFPFSNNTVDKYGIFNRNMCTKYVT